MSLVNLRMKIANWMVKSDRFHLHLSVDTPEHMLGVLDRFLDGKPKYDLEYDDLYRGKARVIPL